MQKISTIGLFFLLMTPLAWVEETAPYDAEQPFQQGFSTSVLRSFLNGTLDVFRDHLEITGNIVPDDVKGDRRGNLRFKFYPEGTSKSDQHHSAEGWFRLKSLQEPGNNSSRQFSDVL